MKQNRAENFQTFWYYFCKGWKCNRTLSLLPLRTLYLKNIVEIPLLIFSRGISYSELQLMNYYHFGVSVMMDMSYTTPAVTDASNVRHNHRNKISVSTPASGDSW